VDGFDRAGRMTSGSYKIATCKNCGAHFQHSSMLDRDTMQIRDACHLLTDEEWQRETRFLRGESDSAV